MIRNFQLTTLSSLCVLVLLAASSQAQITPSQDAFTNSADPTTNFGANTLLDVDGASQVTYIQFNLASIPAGAHVRQATLKLYVNAVTTVGSFNVDYVNGSWVESSITHSLAPALGNTIASGVSLTAADKNQFILINITPAVAAWLNGSQANDGIALVANSEFNASFDSKENTTTSHAPELDIVFAGPAGTITGVTAGTDLTGGGTTGNVTLNLNTTQVPQLNTPNTFTGNQTVVGVLSATGNVGVGTTGPQAQFDVFSNVAGDHIGMAQFGSLGTTDANSILTYNVGGTTELFLAGSAGSFMPQAQAHDGGLRVLPGKNILFGDSTSSRLALDSVGNASQPRTAGGTVKAMIFVADPDTGGIAKCFNSTLTGAAASTPPCGFAYRYFEQGSYMVDFGFRVDDRFLSISPSFNFDVISACTDTVAAVWVGGCGIPKVPSLTPNQVGIGVAFNSGGAADTSFWLMVY